MNLRDGFHVNHKHFKPIKDSEQIIKEGWEKIESSMASLTHSDIVSALKESVIERVTPLAHLTYED